MQMEKTEIWFTCNKPIQEPDGTALRGFFGSLYLQRPEFHGHRGNGLVYKHPLIQYKVFGGSALVVGLKEGAYLLKAVPKLNHLELHHKKCSILKQNASVTIMQYGLTKHLISYRFATPWIALNQENYKNYVGLLKKPEEVEALLKKILVGNLLSMSKALGYVVDDKILVKTKLTENQLVEIKEDLQLSSFMGEFETNFLIPDFWGIGKFSSRGFGTVMSTNGGTSQ